MKTITLRKANALQNSINDALRNLAFNSTLELNEFQDTTSEITTALDQFGKNVTRRGALLDVLFEIRKAVSVANDENGINALLANVARCEKDIQFLTPLSKAQVRMDAAVLTGKLEKLKNRQESPYGYNEGSVTTSIFGESNIEKFKTLLQFSKKLKQQIQDELLELNVRTEITLSDNAVSVLVAEKIL